MRARLACFLHHVNTNFVGSTKQREPLLPSLQVTCLDLFPYSRPLLRLLFDISHLLAILMMMQNISVNCDHGDHLT